MLLISFGGKVLARRVSSSPMNAHFWKKYKEFIQLISYNFMGKHAFWTASFQCLAESLLQGNVWQPTFWERIVIFLSSNKILVNVVQVALVIVVTL